MGPRIMYMQIGNYPMVRTRSRFIAPHHHHLIPHQLALHRCNTMPGTDDERPSPPSKPQASTSTGRRKRQRIFTPDDRASHRVIEKQRREALNTQFIDLARLLPGLASTRRLSKALIVAEAIAHQKKQRAQRLAAAQALRSLRTERTALLSEVHALRVQLGITAHPEAGIAANENDNKTAGGGAEDELLDVESEVFGAFPAGFGDNGDCGDGDDDMEAGEPEELRSRGRRSVSRSVSSPSTSRSPAGAKAPPSPPAQPEASTSETNVRTPAAVYETDAFLALLSAPAAASASASAPLAFDFPPTAEPLGLDVATFPDFVFPPPSSAVSTASPIEAPAGVDDMWAFLQQTHPGASASMAAMGLFDTGLMGGFPMPTVPQGGVQFSVPSP
ncbi:hypothetical protein FB451DRAFT_1281394 [Mycena latifolia]|nr:hypothetical protein FB451DRAFT_1281394 [Mycena latifolia]